ncbi:MAG: hypothetical protein PHC88_02985 [Terrimicrobiaceae bacterium]|nr:hypothetical protein [Terrimicrobiaceae bacterium]
MPAVICSVLLSAILTVALLLATRRRLARQFDDIERRLLQAERTILSIKLGLERDTTMPQLQRLHRGLIRIQENLARRHGGLAPFAAGMNSRFAGEFQLASLREWAGALGVALGRGEIEALTRAIARAEADGIGPIRLETPDLFAGVIALLRWRGAPVHVFAAGDISKDFAALVRALAPIWFERVEVESIGRAARVDALIVDAAGLPAADAFHLVKDGGTLVVLGLSAGDRGIGSFAEFDSVGAEGKIAVYRKRMSKEVIPA